MSQEVPAASSGGRPFDDERGTSPWEQGWRSSPASSRAGGGSTSRHFCKSLAFTREEFRSHETAPGLRDRQPVQLGSGGPECGGRPGNLHERSLPGAAGWNRLTEPMLSSHSSLWMQHRISVTPQCASDQGARLLSAGRRLREGGRQADPRGDSAAETVKSHFSSLGGHRTEV